jgi:hypothetical protein
MATTLAILEGDCLREEDAVTWQRYTKNLRSCYVRLRDDED